MNRTTNSCPRPKRILFVDHVDRILGGAEINLIELIEEAKKHSQWQIAVACRVGAALSQALDKIGVQQFDYCLDPRLNELRFAGAKFPWTRALGGMRALNEARAQLTNILAQFETDAVVSCTNKDHFVACHASPQSIWWVNDLLTPDFFPLPARLAFRHYAAKASRLVAVSHCVKDALTQLGIPREKITVIQNGIPIAKYTSGNKEAFRKANYIHDDEPIFGWIGRICDWKGPELYNAIAGEWKKRQKAGRFFVIGSSFNEDAGFFAWFERSARDIKFASYPSYVPDALAAMDAFLHTSLRPEPFGRVLIEAMAAGVPVIAANAGGACEIIRSGENGFLARPNDAQSYIEKLSLLYPRSPTVEQMIAKARTTVAVQFNVERVYRDFDALLSIGLNPLHH